MYRPTYRRRCEALFLLLFSFLIFCIARLIFVQFFRAEHLKELARKQHNILVELEPRRGVIYDRNLRPQAVNITVDSLYATPRFMKEAEKDILADKLSVILGMEKTLLASRLSKDKSFVWIARKISPEQSKKIKELDLKGLGFIKESKRCYPNLYLASHALGFAGLDNIGLEGLELQDDKYLKGESGWAMMLRDARQQKLDIYENMILPKDGYDLVTTIDEVIQYIVEREIDNVYQKFHAKSASIVVMDPWSGQILAISNRPTYDLNDYASSARESRRNRAICDLFEPGSVFKIVTASAAIEEGKVDEQTKFFCENGEYKVGNHILHDHKPHGMLTFREVIEKSSNIGTTKVAQMLGEDVIYKYCRLFGFGSKLGIDLPGEISGMIKEPKYWSKTSIGAIPIGHEVGTNAIQLVSAVSVIANGGKLMKPYVLMKVKDKFGQPIAEYAPVVLRRVISEATAARIKDILAGVVENGTGRMASMNDFTAAGKTGTAQKLGADGKYSHNKFMATFIGFAPVDKPLIAIAIVVDEPGPYYYGGVVSAPVFKNICEDVLRYLKAKQTFRSRSIPDEGEIFD